MNIAKEWIQRLESGKYTQVFGHYGTGQNRCAVGVLKSLLEDLSPSESDAVINQMQNLSGNLDIFRLNDAEHRTFKEIALILRKRFDLVK